MDNTQIENSLKKMGLVLEKVVKKVDEIDKRLAQIEQKSSSEKKFSSENLKQPLTQQPRTQHSSSSFGSGFGGSFLGSLAGAMAGMGLYNLFFNNNVSADEVAKEIDSNEDLTSSIEEQLNEIDSKLDELDSKIDELDNDDSFVDNDSDIFDDYASEDFSSDDFDV